MRRRIDDPSALLDSLLAHLTLLAALGVVVVAIVVPSARGALLGACLVAAISTLRLLFHPLRLTTLRRVYVEDRKVLVAPLFGAPRPAPVKTVEHDDHAPWPCALVLEDGTRVHFVARRDDGSNPFFDLELSDRARYERPRDARDSLIDLQKLTSRRPVPSEERGT
ncbi:MAG: hypothetical protein ACXVEF_34590 [Polyangiales bacterium]